MGQKAGNTGPGGEGQEKMRESERRDITERLRPAEEAQGRRGTKSKSAASVAQRRREGTRPGRPSARASDSLSEPLMNGPPSSSERAAPRRVPGNPARDFPAGAGPAERLHLHKVPARRPGGAARRGRQPASRAGRGKAAAVRAAWVMETFLRGPRREISGSPPAAHTVSPRGPSCRRPLGGSPPTGRPRYARPSP